MRNARRSSRGTLTSRGYSDDAREGQGKSAAIDGATAGSRKGMQAARDRRFAGAAPLVHRRGEQGRQSGQGVGLDREPRQAKGQRKAFRFGLRNIRVDDGAGQILA